MPKLKPGTIFPTDEEDKAITKAAIADGTYYTDEELENFKPFEESDLPEEFKNAVRKGRPPQDVHKIPVSIRLSAEVVEHYRATGKGWQTRMDGDLKAMIAKDNN
jgi:uncharacterized protein (DUF4415 family)